MSLTTDTKELARIKALREKHKSLVGDVGPHNHTIRELKDLSAFIENVIADIDIPTGELTDHDHDGVDASKVDWADLDNKPLVFPPDTHAHPTTDITNFAEDVADTVGAMVSSNTETGISVTYDDADNTLDFAVSYGTTAATACVGNDSRLSDARTPTSHSHLAADLPATMAPSAHTHGSGDLTDATSTATASKIPVADGSGKLDTWVSDCASGTKGKIQLTGQLGGSAASPTVTGITETGTSQALTFGTIADGGYVKRSGTALATADLYTDIIFTIDGGGAEIADNATIWRQVNFAGTIVSWTLLADASGSITIDIWKDTYANFPPTDADSITASAVPAISTATSATSSTLTGWTTSISAGDVLKINVDSCTTIKTCVLQLKVKL